eukprot:GILK01003422.1.p1 GENE.GILK01003422.1~~GILK01003422.1.p1  ORF type:complete len:516 (-),score=43.59 GILK01003422.1:325-1872(-)
MQAPSLAAGEPAIVGVSSACEGSQSRRWRQIHALNSKETPGPRSGAASVVYGKSLYIFGGYGGSGRLDDLFEFCFEERSWYRLHTTGPTPAGRENNGAVVHKNKMYLFGGYSGSTWLNDFHSLNFDTLEWCSVNWPGAPSTRFGYVSAVWRDSVFIFGGYDGCTWLNDMYEHDIDTHVWTQVHAAGIVPSVRSCPSWASRGDCVYVFGGYDGVHRMNDFHEFNLATRTWTAIQYKGSIVPSPRYFHASVVYGDSLYLFGGYSGHERLNDLYEFKFDSNVWSKIDVDAAPSGRSSLVSQVHNNSMLIFGGYNGSVVLNDFYEFKFEPVAIPTSTFMDDMRKLLNNPQLGDVTFLVEGRSVTATRTHLACRSEHFRALLYGGMKESKGYTEIVIPDIQYTVFLAVLEYLYTDSVRDIDSEIAVPLLIASEKFMLDRLKAICQDVIRRGISSENVVGILLAAHHHHASTLKDICIEFIIQHEEQVKLCRSFKELMQEPELLMEIIMKRPPAQAAGRVF